MKLTTTEDKLPEVFRKLLVVELVVAIRRFGCRGTVKQEDKNPMVTLGISYRVGDPEAIQKILRDYMVLKHFSVSTTRYIDSVELKHRTNCVYQIPCAECLAKYIGQTAGQLHVRMAEHKRHVRLPPRNPIKLRKTRTRFSHFTSRT
ncbi:hypothetical protein T265_09069 [Opisthorchis viverrini]|uniref:C2H2-type domain-containing protein n=1 Tax=Opisthorchis viverrini TaxID=6198 RepID=A0A075A669_OPIVI|nr:hypothetical protein T265_09069 [Opisthorchis viverrini]KER22939.1 hypothetical protein T265_09069 [Opisthorchis viverrini]